MHIYETTHRNSQEICRAFAKGTGFPYHTSEEYLGGDSFMYGHLRGSKEIREATSAARKNYYFADRGYFKASRKDNSGYFRVTQNAFQHNGAGFAESHRWEKLNIEIQDWRKNGEHVLVCPPSQFYANMMGFDHQQWLDETLSTLKEKTDRPVYTRMKPDFNNPIGRPLEQDLLWCHAVVTYASNVAVEALVEGIPVFCLGECAARIMGRDNLSEIENPKFPDDRERFFQVLAANQWTLEEMESGLCWKELGGF